MAHFPDDNTSSSNKLEQLLLSWKIVDNKRQAQTILLIIFLLSIGVIAFTLFSILGVGGMENPPEPPTPVIGYIF